MQYLALQQGQAVVFASVEANGFAHSLLSFWIAWSYLIGFYRLKTAATIERGIFYEC